MKALNNNEKKAIGAGDRERLPLSRKSLRIVAFALAAAVLLGSCGFVLAKYVGGFDLEASAAAANLYMTGDYLTASGTQSYNVYTGAVELRLRNSDGVKVTGGDIYYDVSVFDGAADVTALVTVTDDGAGVLTGGAADENLVTVSGLGYGTTYTIRAAIDTAHAGGVSYAYELSADFAVQSAGDSTVYSVVDHTSYSELIIYTGSAGTLTILYDGYAPDNANPLMTGWSSAQGAAGNQLAVNANTTYRLIFLGRGVSVAQTILSGTTITIPAA